jgi:ADP-ribose pyrophosphatase YjhB (NUDIX family)
MSGHYPFNVRVYGLLFDEGEKRVLLSSELVQGERVTKFPGGGLEFGEGPEDCVVREFLEETGHQVTVLEHFYTTAFFQPSAFDPNEQVISIYYRVGLRKGSPGEEGAGFFWMRLSEMGPEHFELPIDREVARMLVQGISR